MRVRLWTRGAAAIGGACVVVATLLPWGSPDPFNGYRFGAHGAGSVIGISINNTAPFLGPYIGDFLRGGPSGRGADAWHVATLLATVLIAGSLVSVSVALTPLRRSRAAVAIAFVAAATVALLSIVSWIHPPGFSLGPLRVHRPGAGEPLAVAGAAMLLGALGVSLSLDGLSAQDAPSSSGLP